MRTFEYDLPDKELVARFGKACAQSGVANSGLIIDMMSNVYVEEVLDLRRALLARLAGEMPPVRPGALVRRKDLEDSSRGLVVERVLYVGFDPEYVQRNEFWHITTQS